MLTIPFMMFIATMQSARRIYPRRKSSCKFVIIFAIQLQEWQGDMKSKAYSRLGTVADNVQWFAMAACYELEIWEKAYPGLGTLANNVGFSAARRLKASWPSGSVYSRPEAAATKGGLVNFFPTMTSTTVTRLLTKVVKPGTRRWAGLLWKDVSWL